MLEIDKSPAATTVSRSAAAVRAAARPGALAAIGAAVFVLILVAVDSGTGLASFDPGLTHQIVAARTPALNTVAETVTFFGSEIWLAAVTLASAGILLIRAERFRAGLIVASMAASASTTVLIKLIVDRPRPGALVEIGVPEASYSFPSGHTLNSTVCYGIIALVTLPLVRSVAARLAIGLTVGVLVFAIGTSRLYLGYHWATDVLAGWTLGLSILAVAATVTTLWRQSVRAGAKSADLSDRTRRASA